MDQRRVASLLAAVALTAGVAAAPTPAGLTPAGQYALATMAFAATLWVTGALPLAVTSLLVPALLGVLGVYSRFEDALSGFADPVVFLFLATFVLAAALQRHGLDRRVALRLVARFGSSPRRLVLGVMVTTAVLSMVVSNTATAAMMLPIAVGLVAELDAGDTDNLHVSLVLGTAYAASVGGVGTLVGTPPNAIAVATLRETLGVDVSFFDWLAVGLPVVAVTLPVVWAVLTYWLYPPRVADVSAARDAARAELAGLGPLDAAARRTAGVFLAVAVLWVLGGLGFLAADVLPDAWHVTLFGGSGPSVFDTVGHTGVLYYALVGLLAVPALVLLGCVDESDVFRGVDWPTLLLFGGGISLADALSDTRATEWLAAVVFDGLALPVFLALVALVVLVTVAFSELASNTATVAILAPVLVALGATVAPAYGLTAAAAGVTLVLAAAVGASFGFALPVATPPNAIAYGTGEVTRDQMLRAGLTLDVLFVPITTLLVTGVAALLLAVIAA